MNSQKDPWALVGLVSWRTAPSKGRHPEKTAVLLDFVDVVPKSQSPSPEFFPQKVSFLKVESFHPKKP